MGGMKVYQWNGSSAGIWEKQKAAELVRAIDDERKSAVDITTCEQGADGDFRWDVIEGGMPDPIPAATPDDQPQHTLKLFKASDESGNLEVTEIASGKDVTEDKLDTNDVFILGAGHTIYVWIGKGASAQERKMGLQIAADYVKKAGKPANQSIARVMETARTRPSTAASRRRKRFTAHVCNSTNTTNEMSDKKKTTQKPQKY